MSIPYLYDLIEPGYKFNFTDLQASMGIEQLKKLDQIITYRKKIRSLYDKELNNLQITSPILFTSKNTLPEKSKEEEENWEDMIFLVDTQFSLNPHEIESFQNIHDFIENILNLSLNI